MDVRCERCSTEYEFDDALVSGRGTTVKCTNCGHKFKIRRSDGDFSEDFWNVRTRDGRTLVFTSLRELQRAIQAKLVTRYDQLSRGGLAPKAIDTIQELLPFFEMARPPMETIPGNPGDFTASAPAPITAAMPQLGHDAPRPRQSTRPDFPPAPAPLKTTLHGTGPLEAPTTERDPVHDVDVPPTTQSYDRPPPTPAMPRPSEPAKPVDRFAKAVTAVMGSERTETSVVFELPKRPSPSQPDRDPEPAEPAEKTPIGGSAFEPAAAEEPPQPEAPRSSPSRRGFHRRYTPTPMDPIPARPAETYLERNDRSPDPFDGRQRQQQPLFDVSSPLPPPSAPVRRTSRLYDEVSDPIEPLDDEPPSRRRSVGGFLVAVVVLAGVGLLAAVWARDHLGTTLGISKPAPAPTVDARVAELLATGEKALADGDLELAKESFDKASGRAEKDPRVLVALARLAAQRADELWLKSRLLPTDAPEEAKMTRDLLVERTAAAQKTSGEAFAVVSSSQSADPNALTNAVRVRIDALRIAGDRDGARALVGRLGAATTTPESAYVLAALDLAEPEPLWPTVIERLRTAASTEAGPGRARAALVYALVRSGDVTSAKAEVDRLAAMPRQHPLLLFLRAFAERGGVAVASGAKLDAGAPVDAGPGAAVDDPKKPKDVRAPDARALVAQAETARARGQWDKASQLYAAALDRNPNDTEALSGLAAIAHSRRDLNGARASYKRVLSINPSYVPALVGLGDVDWEAGDRASAMKTYKEIVDRFPEGSYPPRVKQRIDAAGGG